MAAQPTSCHGALHGVTVVDLSRVLAGPYAGQMLGDHGAEVIKVEPPRGDTTRLWGPSDDDAVSPYYAGLNRNKHHLSINLGTDAGRGILLSLLEDADVLIENFLAGTMSRWELDTEQLLERFPRLIYCRISAFGVKGPMAGLPGYDAVVQAYSGLMSLNGEPGRGPVRIPMPVTDLTTGMLAFSGILLALHERHVSGLGQLVDVSLLDSALSLHHPAAANYFTSGVAPQRIGSRHPNIAPCDVFAGPDSDVYVSAGTDEQFERLCEYLGAPEVAADPRFSTNVSRCRHREDLTITLSSLFEQAAVGADSMQEMMSLGIPVSPVRPLESVLVDDHVLQQDMTPTVGSFRVLGVPVKLSRTPGTVRTPPRAQGADSVSILQRLGLSADIIDRLVESGAVLADTRAEAPAQGDDSEQQRTRPASKPADRREEHHAL